MANTFKFGNGKWAVKDGAALAYNDENNNFKPLPFDFTRASSATRVNREGLIKVVGQNKPRIDFTDNTSGHLLLEPSRTNALPYSEDFSQWSPTTGITITGSQFNELTGNSDAYKIETNGSTGFLQISETIAATSGNNTYSVFAKKGTNNKVSLRGLSGVDFRVVYDLDTGTIDSQLNTVSSKIENYGSGWYRLSVVFSGANTTFYIYPSTLGTADAGNIYVYGAQLEAGSYATSYIPTEGSSVTRVAEEANSAGNSNVFNDSEGVFYAEVKALNSNVGTNRKIVLGDGSYNNGIEFGYQSTNNKMQFIIRSSTGSAGITMNVETTAFDVTEFNKIAISYKSNEGKVFVNGSQVGTTDTSVTTPATINQLDLKFSTAFDFNSIVKDIKVYNIALSDSELQALTS